MTKETKNMKNRLEDVNSYKLLDTPPEKELDDITELASIICGAPIALITILDDKRQWFKSNKGLSVGETKIEDSFCQHALHKPNEVLVINDTFKDQRFIKNKLVLEDPHIRFYAGAPLITKRNNVLGTLCIIDRKPREFTEDQARALQILAREAMHKIETQKIFKKLNTSVKLNIDRLIKITENIPLGIFELVVSKSGDMKFSFLSTGMKKIYPDKNLDEWIKNPSIASSLIHPDDILPFQDAIALSIENEEKLYHAYRVKRDSGYDWYAIDGQPHKAKNGKTIIYGAFTDITHHIHYQETLEQIAFDISHVLRKPLTTILGITNLVELEHEQSTEKLKEYWGYVKTASEELEEFTRKLNKVYSEKKLQITTYNNRYKT
ncbi:MAG: hypothetical protein ACJA1B_001240 [Polaribacter sp.]